MTTKKEIIAVLASGGIDSTALIDFYLRKGLGVKGIHFQYGQENAKSELEAFEKIKSFYGIEGQVIKFDFQLNKKQYEVIGRNALFVFITSFSTSAKRIAIGIQEGCCYYDCSRSFLRDSQKILDGYFSGSVQVEAPFIDLNKQEILSYCKDYKVPIELTYSCQKQNEKPCGGCPTCIELASLGRKHE
ncbi:MAG: 7-cyano-7-deazaguanine synthase [Candidatus Bathyarchaeia archaeon]